MQTVAVGATGLALGCQDKSAPKIETELNIGLQLWTFRDDIEKNAEATLSKISALGIKGVETAFWPDHITLDVGAKLLRDAKLPVISIHAELPIGENKDEMLRMADAYECNRMVWHGWPEDERYQTNDGVHELAEIYNDCASWMSGQGLELGLHNHWWEFREVEGQYPFYLLLDHISEEIFFEIDTYWTKFAGLDPAKVIRDFGSRAALLHMKDGEANSENGPMVALGSGVQNFPEIMKAAKNKVEWYIIEFDSCETDIYEAVESSIQYLKMLG